MAQVEVDGLFVTVDFTDLKRKSSRIVVDGESETSVFDRDGLDFNGVVVDFGGEFFGLVTIYDQANIVTAVDFDGLVVFVGNLDVED